MGRILGIDLGTTNSLAACYLDGGPKVVPLPSGALHLPSAVALDPVEGLIVGKAAREGLRARPESTILSVKRHMGTGRTFLLGGEELRPQDISALILKELKRAVEGHLRTVVDRAVISVPAYFNEVQRRATREAGEIAGLRVERLISEPTAAALAYGLDRLDQESLVLVYDLGGGTFDVSILEMFEGVLSVRASGGDSLLGGDDFDERISRWIVERAREEHGLGEATPQSMMLLRAAVERAKIQLSDAETAEIRLDRIELAAEQARSLRMSLSRSRFEKLTRDLLERTGRCVTKVLGEAGVTRERIGEVILVGGSTRMPMVARYLAELFGKEPRRCVDPMHAVALGAAIQAHMLEGGSSLEELVVTDVSPFTLGVSILGDFGGEFRPGVFDPLIHRNTSLPASMTKEFATIHPEQHTVVIEVYQGDDPLVENNIFLDRYYLGGIPPNKERPETIEIQFQYDVDGILHVNALIKSTGKSAGIRIDPGKMKSVGQGLIGARTKVDALWEGSRPMRRLRTLVERIEVRLDSFPQAKRLRLEEKLKLARQALASGDREAMSNLADDVEAIEAEAGDGPR